MEPKVVTERDFHELVDQFIADTRGRLAGGLTFGELKQTCVQFLCVAIEWAAWLKLTGSGKKQAVLDGVGFVFDQISAERILPPSLRWLWPLVRVPLRALILYLANHEIEGIYRHLFPAE